MLKKLLFHHGRESYRRNTNLVLYNFFKNINVVLPSFWIGFELVFSGQRVYDSWLNAVFNVFFASLPIVIYAIFDREYQDNSLMTYPFLYEDGLKYRLFNSKRFWSWCLFAAV
jgi:phospholipid-transporting ATPase